MAKITERIVASTSTESVNIDLDKMPAREMDDICRVILRDTREYFKHPGVEAEFKKWQEARANTLKVAAAT